MQRKTIIYIGNFLLPDKDAAAQLVNSNVKILKELGYTVIVIGKDENYNSKVSFSETKDDGIVISYKVPFPKGLNEQYHSIKRYNELIKYMSSNKDNIKAVICYGSPATTVLLVTKVRQWCNRNNKTFIANIADISSLTHGNILSRLVKKLNFIFLKLNFKYYTNGIIAVSDYIRDYYAYSDNSICIIPPLVDSVNLPVPSGKRSDFIKIIYAGIPFPVDGRKVDESSYKDRLDVTLEFLYEVHKINPNFQLNIYGLSKDEYLGVIQNHKDILKEMDSNIFFHGRVSHTEILKNIAYSDFTINLRDINEMTTAGFSTKFVESISCGTPTITTNTSDLSRYLIEGENGFFINIENKEEAVNKITNIFNMNSTEIQNMKKKCYESKLFDYRNYIKVMEEFLNNYN